MKMAHGDSDFDGAASPSERTPEWRSEIKDFSLELREFAGRGWLRKERLRDPLQRRSRPEANGEHSDHANEADAGNGENDFGATLPRCFWRGHHWLCGGVVV